MGLARGPNRLPPNRRQRPLSARTGKAGKSVGHWAARRPGWSPERPITSGRPERTRVMGLARCPNRFRRTGASGLFRRERTLGSCASSLVYFAFGEGRGPGRLRLSRNNGWFMGVRVLLPRGVHALAAGTQDDQRTYPRGLAQPPRVTSRLEPHHFNVRLRRNSDARACFISVLSGRYRVGHR